MDIESVEDKVFLQDINRFLIDTLKNEDLTSKAKTERDQLVQRLSCLLEPIGPYIDMSGSTKCVQSEEYVAMNTTQNKNIDSKLYEEFPDLQILSHSEPQECRPSINIEHLILPASKLRMVGQKFGVLSRKERFMGLFVWNARSIRCYVGILGHNLYVYNSDKDTKPATVINLQGFEARPAITYLPKDTKNRDFGFEVVCPGKKSYQFLASSFHEMQQWIICINEIGTQLSEIGMQDCGESHKKLTPKPKCLPCTPSSLNDVEEYDDIQGNDDSVSENNEEYGDDIYHNIKDLSLMKEKETVPSIEQHSESKHFSGKELVYDDICSLNPELYYNVNDQATEGTYECDTTQKDTFCYDDKDVYDDIGVLSKNPDIRYSNSIDSSSNRLNIARKKDAVLGNNKSYIFGEVITDLTDSVLGKSCIDNLYEPVENPRDE